MKNLKWQNPGPLGFAVWLVQVIGSVVSFVEAIFVAQELIVIVKIKCCEIHDYTEMKVIYVYYAVAIYGGIERVLVDKMNSLANMGYDVFLLTTNQGNHPLPFTLNKQIHFDDLNVQTHLQYRYNGFRRYWERFRRNMQLYKRLSVKIHAICPDIIVTATNGYISELAKIKGNVPLVVELHTGFDYVMEDTEDSWLRRMQLRCLRKKLHKADVILS